MYAALFLSIIFISLIPVLLIKHRLITVRLSYPFLFLLVISTLSLTINSRPTLTSLGLVAPSTGDLLIHILATLIACLLIGILNHYRFHQSPVNNIFRTSSAGIALYTILSAPAQEFLFRSFVYYSLSRSDSLNVFSFTLLSSLLFGIAHLAFDDHYLNYGTFIMGLVWGLAYYFAPNLYLISISHAVVGLFALQQGLIKPRIFFTQAI